MFIVVFAFLFVDMFDTIGTVIAVSLKAGMVDKNGNVDGVGRMLMVDAVATTAGACMGASTTTTFVESTTGVAVGAHTVGVDWDDYSEAIPAFFTLLMTPLSYSINDGIMMGSIMYVLMKICKGKAGIRQISPMMWTLFVIFIIRYVHQSL